MIEALRLKNVILLQTILSFVLSRKAINIYNDLEKKQGNLTVKDFRKYEKLDCKKNKLKLDIDFLHNYKQLGGYPKFLIFNLPNVSNKSASSIRKILLRNAINKRHKELQHVLKVLNISNNFFSKQLSTADFYISKKFIISNSNKSRQKSLYTQQKKLYSLREVAAYLYPQLAKLLLTSSNMNYPKKNSIYLKQVYTCQSNEIKFKNSKSLLPLKKFIVLLLTTILPRKPKVK